MTGRLAGKVAAITGSASGFGETAARLFVAEGALVALGDIQTDRGRAIADDLGEAARFIECDVTREDHVAALVDLAVDSFGQLDVMYNNAGIVGARGPIDQLPADEWRFTVDVLLHGVFYGMKHAARVMKPRRCGSIISMASTAGVIGGLGPHAYAAAKHAVVGLTKNAGAELCRFGIRVNCIAPHSMATPMVAMAHLGDPDDIDGVLTELAERSPLAGPAGAGLRRRQRHPVARQRRVGLHQRPLPHHRRRGDHWLEGRRRPLLRTDADHARGRPHRAVNELSRQSSRSSKV